MSQAVSDNIISALYLLVWIATFTWYHIRRPYLDAGSSIIGTYVVYAIFSILSINDYMFNFTYEELHVFPYIYLYVMLMIALSPTIYMHTHPAREIRDPHTRMLKPLAWLIILCSLMLLPGIYSNFGSGIVNLFLDSDAGKDAYEEQLAGAGEGGSAITNIPAIIFNALRDIAIFLAFYFVTLKKKNKLITSLLFLSIFIGLLLPVAKGQRSDIILVMLTVILAFFLFKQFYSKFVLKLVRMIGIIGLVVMILPVAAITASRYSDTTAGITGYLNWYVGQGNVYFNNWGLDAHGIRYGERTANLAIRLVKPDTPSNYEDLRHKYHNMKMSDHYFTTFVGDFCLDYGPIVTFIIFFFFNIYVLMQIKPRDGTMSLHQILLVYFTMCICMQGGMYLFAYSFTANLRIVTFLLLYGYLRYHDALLEKYPKKKEAEETADVAEAVEIK